MTFSETLNVRKGITAIIGSGGKTSLMFRLAEELRENASVIVCTTTHIAKPEHIPVCLGDDVQQVRELLRTERLVCAATEKDGKLSAPKLPLAVLAELADYVLVEADGSKRLPIKAHAAHEPVIPEQSNQIIAVVGLSGIGKPVRDVVHRPEIFCKNLGISQSTLLTPQMVAEHLLLENLHTAVFLNQADDETAKKYAAEIAALLHTKTFAGALQKGTIECLR